MVFASVQPKRTVIFIHGYSGGPTDLAELPEIVRREFSSEVYCPLLPGHGTSIDELLHLSSSDLLDGIERQVADAVRAGKTVVLVGVSFGAQVALHLASKYAVAGTVAINATHGLKFPLNIPGIGLMARVKPAWSKHFSATQRADRANAILYDDIPTKGLFLSKELRHRVDAAAGAIRSSVLFIHSTKDRFGNPRAVQRLRRKIAGPTQLRLVRSTGHSLFFSGAKKHVIAEIVSFLKREDIFGSNAASEKKVTAIVPAFNESSHVVSVLGTLLRSPSVGEVIVVDDGSSDDVTMWSEPTDGVSVLRNGRNLGKAASLDRGARAASFDVILFCDADLVGLKPEHVEAIVQPVISGEYDMFIGVRGNVLQTTVRAFALNSGERALRKETWFALPAFFKHRYRVEAGLNFYVKHGTARGLGWKVFDYTQVIKESKYGILKGTVLRWWMNFDVACAYLSYPILYWQLRRNSRNAHTRWAK